MGFERRIYEDGDIEFNIPQWRKNIELIKELNEPINFENELKKDRRIKRKEVALKHLNNNSFIRINDEGSIEAFTGSNSGIRMSEDGTTTMFGNKLQLIFKELEILTTPNGTTLNGYTLGKDTIQNFPRKKGKEISFLEMAKEYGIETNQLEESRLNND